MELLNYKNHLRNLLGVFSYIGNFANFAILKKIRIFKWKIVNLNFLNFSEGRMNMWNGRISDKNGW